MTPEPSLVAELAAYDKALRIRWARHSEKWLVERHQPASDPRLANALPPPDSATPIRKDLYEGWREGYVHVLTVARNLAHWAFIGPELSRLDSWRQGGVKAINRALDEEAVAFEAAADKKIDNYVEAATDDAYEHLAWASGRRVAMEGFTVTDRRIGAA